MWLLRNIVVGMMLVLSPQGVESGREELKWGLCGGVAGISSKMVMLPLDIVKKRLEVKWELGEELGLDVRGERSVGEGGKVCW